MAYQIHTHGIKVFIEANRLDFNLEDPSVSTEKPAAKTSVFFNKMDSEVKLNGSKLTILPAVRDDDGNLVNPNRLDVKWGRKTLYLGRAVPKNGGKEYYYTSLETANDAARPKTADELFAAMGR